MPNNTSDHISHHMILVLTVLECETVLVRF